MQIAYIILEAIPNFFLLFLPGVMMEQKSLLRYNAYKTPTVSPTLPGNNRSIFLLQVKNISYKHRRSAHDLTEKIEHKFQKICGGGGGRNHSTEKW